jgi:hypothetical protein
MRLNRFDDANNLGPEVRNEGAEPVECDAPGRPELFDDIDADDDDNELREAA